MSGVGRGWCESEHVIILTAGLCVWLISFRYPLLKQWRQWQGEYIQGVPKFFFPCLRGYNFGKNGTFTFEIYMQFSFWWALKFLHLDHWNLRKWSLKMVTLLLKSWQNPTQILLYSSLSAINYFYLIQTFIWWLSL